MANKIVQDFLMLWTTIDPIGNIAFFAALTGHLAAAERRRLAIKSTIYSVIILMVSLALGEIILDAMGIKLVSLQVAGGIILFLFGLQMIFSDGESSTPKAGESGHDLAVFPLAIPTIASPGAIMAIIVLTENKTHSVVTQATTGIVLLCILGINLVLMLLCDPILRVIGKNGASILVRIMGMILASLSVEIILSALNVGPWVIPKL